MLGPRTRFDDHIERDRCCDDVNSAPYTTAKQPFLPLFSSSFDSAIRYGVLESVQCFGYFYVVISPGAILFLFYSPLSKKIGQMVLAWVLGHNSCKP